MRRVPLLRIALCLATALAGPVSSVAAQTAWVVPRTPDGHPDLQGNWSNETLTPFQRPRDQGRILTPEEVTRIEQRRTGGADPVCFYGPGTCNDLITLVEAGDFRVATVNGEPRSSLVTNPPDGRVPSLTPEGLMRSEDYRALRSQFGQYDHPELAPLSERCLVSFGSSAGPPMIPNRRLYNNNYTIVQTADHVLIMKVIERFSRVDEETILYEFTIDDPTTYADPWGGAVPMKALHDRLYEYACHEGNHNLVGILRGARYQERLEVNLQR